jgi:hypothetical protein
MMYTGLMKVLCRDLGSLGFWCSWVVLKPIPVNMAGTNIIGEKHGRAMMENDSQEEEW